MAAHSTMSGMKLPPGPRMPAAAQTARWIARPLPYLDECARKFGDIFSVRWVGAGTMVMVSSPELVKQVFTADADVLHAGEGNALLEPMVGKHSLLTLDEGEHLRQRRLLLPSFHGERMQAYAETMREIAEATLAEWPVDEPFALHPYMQSITLDVILKTVFGADPHGPLRAALVRLLDLSSNPIGMIPALFGLDIFKLAPWSRRAQLKRRIDALIYEEIARRREAPTGGTDVLSMMLEARDEAGNAMTDVELRDELVTLLVAGHETTATSLAWTFEQLLAHPPAFERLRAELAAGKDDYLDAVIKEVQRLRPILPMVGRYVAKPFTLGAWTVPPGAFIAPCIYLSQRRPESYPEPGRFLPERWLGAKADPYTWLPFGGGIRRCIGMAFALFEMKIVLQTIVPRAALRFERGGSHVVRRAITLAPSKGVRVVLERRLASVGGGARRGSSTAAPGA
jgi:cytochrome P450